ncbi:hypothetical protein HCN51_36340 [Nonomuraea sp. FMUSA5-5]|uniref:DUF2127 domain-containing protein n=1 Tax=Nonomuraea composti TaxID=2720023 RepID=A0ABX1BAM8_9ACTN|nr:hypothetical protein [Nonomuraea sp. FMUSA5-5]NJP94845.1 hypothetical protein [Nonomuraea sp. FMUSA5-5]
MATHRFAAPARPAYFRQRTDPARQAHSRHRMESAQPVTMLASGLLAALAALSGVAALAGTIIGGPGQVPADLAYEPLVAELRRAEVHTELVMRGHVTASAGLLVLAVTLLLATRQRGAHVALTLVTLPVIALWVYDAGASVVVLRSVLSFAAAGCAACMLVLVWLPSSRRWLAFRPGR